MKRVGRTVAVLQRDGRPVRTAAAAPEAQPGPAAPMMLADVVPTPARCGQMCDGPTAGQGSKDMIVRTESGHGDRYCLHALCRQEHPFPVGRSVA